MTFSKKVFKTALTSSYIKAEILLTPPFLANLLMASFVISWMLSLRIFLCLLASPLPKPFSTFSFTRHRYFCLIIPVVRKERRGGKQESNVYATMNYAPNIPTRRANARVLLRRPPACLTLFILPSWPTCTQLFPHRPASQRPRPLSRTNTLSAREATLASLNLKSRPAPRLPLKM